MKRSLGCKAGIVASVGRALCAQEALEEAMAMGALNFRLALGLRDRNHEMDFDAVRSASYARGVEVNVLLDLPATRPRVGRMEGRVFEPGERVVLIDAESARRQRVAVIPVPGLEPLVGKLEPGQRILFRDGRQQFRVVDKARRTVYAECERCSEPVNAFNACTFPDSGLTFDPVGEPDREALSAFRKMGLTPDWVMVSLATRQEQIDQVREVVNGMWPEAGVRIMAKVELGEAVQRIDDILDASDGLLLGRGDLGLSIAPERLPTVQEQVAAKARAVDKPLLIATQMLEVFSATGTIYRAELSDIALAVRQGAAGVVLCAETSDSERPGQVIDLARRVIEMEGIRSPA